MAKLSGGILGGFSGKVGQVVGGFWKGIAYMRERKIPSNPDSPLQRVARDNMAAAMSYARANNDALLKLGFGYVTKGKKLSAINKFIKKNVTGQIFLNNMGTIQWSEGNVSPVIISNAKYNTVNYKITCDMDVNENGFFTPQDKVYLFVSLEASPVCPIVVDPANGDFRAGTSITCGTGMIKILGTERPKKSYLHAVVVGPDGQVSNTSTTELTDLVGP